MPDYVNTGNNIGRRIVTLRFDHPVTAQQGDLLQRIVDTELPNVIHRLLSAYATLRVREQQAAGGFWRLVPYTIIQWQSRLAAATNRLYAFLDMDPEERGCSITREEGRVTWVLDLKAAFQAAMPGEPWVLDIAVLHSLGYTHEPDANVCLSCKQIARGRPAPCCNRYGERRRKDVVINMRLTRVDTELPAKNETTG
jgi:hypothetical protein